MVLGRSAEQSHAANVDLLHGLIDGDVDLSDGLLEGVQVADDVVNLGDLLLGEVLLVGLDITGEDTTVHGGVEGLNTATEHLGGVGDGGDIPEINCQFRDCLLNIALLIVFPCVIDDRGNSLDRESGLTDHLGGTARCEKTDFLLDQTLGQVKQTSLVIDGDDSYSIPN